MSLKSIEAGPLIAPDQHWTRSAGDFSILGGSSLITHCEPHFHETFVIAYMRKGTSRINFRGRHTIWRTGEIFLCNPYELVSGESTDGELVYDVCYPSQSFMREVLGGASSAVPHLSAERLSPRDIRELADILADFSRASNQSSYSSSTEERLIGFIRSHSSMVVDQVTRADMAWVSRVHDEFEHALDGRLSIATLADRLRCDRSHLMRVFRRATGLPPSSYVRQLRLARALEDIRSGAPLAVTAASFGFADQAHLTREFKRVYGTTPGKLARDLLH
jgi:AraC-like DNA-binding protein